ncbi:MAG: TA system VapC family ribonuclease toxin [Thermoleophilia bacterium]
MRIVDTSVLLSAAVSSSPHHQAAREALEAAIADERPAGLTWVALNGVIRLLTRPGVFERTCSVGEAFAIVEQWLAADGVVVVQETPGHARTWRTLLEAAGSAGDLTTDAWIAAIAIGHGASVLSLDSDFARFPGVVWENPRASS